MENSIIAPVDFIAIIKRRKWYIVVPFASVFFLSIIIAFVLPPVYKATTTILIEQQDIPVDFVKTTVSTYAEQQMQIINQRIMSSSRLLEIINKLNLYPKERDSMMTADIIAHMRNDISLEPISVNVIDPKTGRPATATIAFTISYEGKNDPNKVLQTANVLASLFLEENIHARLEQATEVSKFLQDEFNKVKGDLEKIDASIVQFKEEHVNDLPELVQVNMQGIMDIERNIDLLNNQMAQLKDREGFLKVQLANTPREFMETDRQRLNELNVKLVNLKNQFSNEHPDVIKTKAEIAQLEQRLKTSSKNESKAHPDNPGYITIAAQLSSTQSEIATVNAQVRDLNARLLDYRRRIELSPKVESDYKVLLMERSNTQAKYDDLQKKYMESKVSQGLEKEQKGERFTLIDPARLPEKPYKPNRRAIMFIGLVLGIGAGIGGASIKEFLDTSVHKASTLAAETSFPVLASIPIIMMEENSRKVKTRWILLGIGLFLAIICGLIIFNFFVMDLEIFWVKLLRWLSMR